MTVYLNALGVLCALGRSQAEVTERLLAGDTSGLRPRTLADGRVLPVGTVTGALPALHDAGSDTRNNRLLLAALEQVEPDVAAAIARYGRTRIAVVLGTSTTGIDEASRGIAAQLNEGAPPARYHYAQQELVAPARLLAEHLALSGPTYVVSTACTSSARALLSARRLLRSGLCDAVLCGGVDTLCELTLQGFGALEATATERCNPFSRHRAGINIGEAAALFLMTREPAPVALLGGAASSDAHHISAPDPEGHGAIATMQAALASARLTPNAIDYLNLHGTATRHNDAMESLAVNRVFPAGVPCSSTKPLTGHTLGAAGALEAAFCWLLLSGNNPAGRLPPHRWDGAVDPALTPLQLVDEAHRLRQPQRGTLMSNSFAFGGNNCSLILGSDA